MTAMRWLTTIGFSYTEHTKHTTTTGINVLKIYYHARNSLTNTLTLNSVPTIGCQCQWRTRNIWKKHMGSSPPTMNTPKMVVSIVSIILILTNVSNGTSVTQKWVDICLWGRTRKIGHSYFLDKTNIVSINTSSPPSPGKDLEENVIYSQHRTDMSKWYLVMHSDHLD